MPEAPRVFISYSHDSPEHKRWVAHIATVLREKGVDAILDQWDLGFGDDVTLFMEKGLSESDRVLAMCTPEYVRKADAGVGGVGYERMIVTAEIVRDIGTNKFIPVICPGNEDVTRPKCLETRFHVDFRDGPGLDEQIALLLSELHGKPAVTKPPLGRNPFAVTPSGDEAIREASSGIEPPELPKGVREPLAIYGTAVALARRGDIIGWRQLVKDARRTSYQGLLEWRSKYDLIRPADEETLLRAVDEAIENISPLLVIALVGVESGANQLKDQRALLDDLLNVERWSYSGQPVLVELPIALGFAYQALHGALCFETGQWDLAVSLANTSVHTRDGDAEILRRRYDLVGGPRSLAGNYLIAWRFLSSAYTRLSFINALFSSERDYRAGLVAYFLCLNLLELCDFVAQGGEKSVQEGKTWALDVPLCCLSEERETIQRGISFMERSPQLAPELCRLSGVGLGDIKRAWPVWNQICSNWASRYCRSSFSRQLPHGSVIGLS